MQYSRLSNIWYRTKDKNEKWKKKKKERKRDIMYRQVHCLMNKAVSFTSLPPNLSVFKIHMQFS